MLSGITKFADHSPDEFLNYTGRRQPSKIKLGYEIPFCGSVIYKPKGPIPPTLDYRKLGYITPVRKQKKGCGSCYAHSTVGKYIRTITKGSKDITILLMSNRKTHSLFQYGSINFMICQYQLILLYHKLWYK